MKFVPDIDNARILVDATEARAPGLRHTGNDGLSLDHPHRTRVAQTCAAEFLREIVGYEPVAKPYDTLGPASVLLPIADATNTSELCVVEIPSADAFGPQFRQLLGRSFAGLIASPLDRPPARGR